MLNRETNHNEACAHILWLKDYPLAQAPTLWTTQPEPDGRGWVVNFATASKKTSPALFLLDSFPKLAKLSLIRSWDCQLPPGMAALHPGECRVASPTTLFEPV